jgi:hypothetical protein
VTVTITQDIRDIGNVPDNVTVRFGSPVPREVGSSLITMKWKSFTAVAGILTAVVEPGPAKVMIRHVGTFDITIPNTDSDLWSLISAAVGIPATTSAAMLAQAVNDYFTAHPVVEWESYANLAAFPATGNGAKEYLAQDTGKLYRWNGSAYVQIADKAAVGLGNVDNTSDVNKPVSTAQQTAINARIQGQACSTDGTNSLPTPTGTGLEFVITATGLDDIRFNGTSL